MQLIDKWNFIPEVWDAVMEKCDETTQTGNYILTCLTKLTDEVQKAKIHHSGAGRIGKIKMHTMSLYELEDFTGKVSIRGMIDNPIENKLNDKITLERLADFIVRGGWSSRIKTTEGKIEIISRSYIDSILYYDILDDKNGDNNKMLMRLKSLARNEATIVGKKTFGFMIEVRDLRIYMYYLNVKQYDKKSKIYVCHSRLL